MDNNVESNTNFWTEINKNNIHVPYYQRDYAQGRCDAGRIDNIRKVFVEELYQAITDPNGKIICHLGLVFGSYDEDKKIFIAVDGQQRLTTVFLLHWFVAWREGKLSDYEKSLKNFSWDTRSYSSQFVALLFNIKLSNNVIEAIKTSCNYFSIWENDPTVKGMLTMLNEIEKQYPISADGLCSKLFSNDCNIRYDILRLERNSDGKTYLKMNSRGRSLTTFELFKSKFIAHHPSFATKFDTSWLIFMLAMSKNENDDFADPDISYMNFINEYTYLMLRSKDIEDTNVYNEFIAAKLKDNLIDVPFISFEKYNPAFDGPIDCFSIFFDWIIDNYKKIKGIDEELGFTNSETKEREFFLDKIIKSHNPTFYHRTKFLSLYKFAELTKFDVLNEGLYRKWNRVFRNLVENSVIDASRFGDICKIVNEINNSDIYVYLSCGGKLSTFNEKQVKEERDKAKQILNENGSLRKYDDKYTWEDIIKEAESYAFFKGAIRFLFTVSNRKINWDDFDTKWENSQKFFDKKGVKNEYKVLLTKSLVIQCTNWNDQLYDKQIFNPNASTWKWILCSSIWDLSIHNILMSNDLSIIKATSSLKDNNVDQNITLLLPKLPFDKMIQDIPDGRFRWYRGRLGFYLRQSSAIIFDWGKWKRNHILMDLLNNTQIETDQKINDYFFEGWDINFKYNNHCFQWWRNPNDTELDVYLMKENWKYCERKVHTSDKNTDEDKYFCFRVTEDMGTADFLKKLECLIQQACAEEAGKDCFNDCPNERNNHQS